MVDHHQGTKGRGRGKATLLEDARVNREIARCCQVLQTTFRVLGVSIREVERLTGRSHSYWNNVFSGEIGLSLKLLLSLAYALEIEPAELFRLLYPVPPPHPSSGFLLLAEAGERVGILVKRGRGLLDPSSSQAARWARCAEVCGYASIEEWLAAAAEAEVLRQRVVVLGEEVS